MRQHIWPSITQRQPMSLFITPHWLPVAARNKFKSLMLAYRIATSTAPTFLKSLIQVDEPSLSPLLGMYMSINAMWHLLGLLSVEAFFFSEYYPWSAVACIVVVLFVALDSSVCKMNKCKCRSDLELNIRCAWKSERMGCFVLAKVCCLRNDLMEIVLYWPCTLFLSLTRPTYIHKKPLRVFCQQIFVSYEVLLLIKSKKIVGK